MGTRNMEQMQRNLIGSREYATSQMCICDYCGLKIVCTDQSCDDQICVRCGATMRAHTGMKITNPLDVTPSDAWGHVRG